MLLSSLTNAGPIAIPGEIPRPCSIRSGLRVPPSVLIKPAGDQRRERRHRALGVGSRGAKLYRGAGAGRKHHEAHDGAAGDRGSVLRDGDLGVELEGKLDETGRSARVQPALVADDDGSSRGGALARVGRLVHQRTSARSCEATLMYFRPASWAPRTASESEAVWRRLASLISIGRLMPAITSILAL